MSVTIKDVAEKANTSIATVSKVMNCSYSISEETVERVNQGPGLPSQYQGEESGTAVESDDCFCDDSGQEYGVFQPAYV